MKRLLLLALFPLFAFAELQVFSLQQPALDQKAKKEKWTFKYREYNREFHTGLVKPVSGSTGVVSPKFSKADNKVPKRFLLSSLAELAPVPDQKSCGSCVYFAVISAFEDTMRVRGLIVPTLSHQELMDCHQRDWRCNGSYFEKVGAGLVNAKTLFPENLYPYRAVNGNCRKDVVGEKFGKVESIKLIDPTPESIGKALVNKYAVPVTIGAGGAWMNYASGVFTACSSVGTNHQVEVVGMDCETSVDTEGYCKFDAKGNLPKGVGAYLIKNSWSPEWGDGGYVWMKITDKNGNKCNNVAEEAGIIETGIDPEPPCEPKPKADAGMDKSILLEGDK